MSRSQRATSERQRWAHHLARVPALRALDEPGRLALAQAAIWRKLERGELLFALGGRDDLLAVVLSGRLDVQRVGPDGERLLLALLGPGDAVGLSVVAGAAHSADVVAAGRAELLAIPGAALRRLLAAKPELALRVIAQLGELLGEVTDALEALRTRELCDRVRARLSHLGRGRRELRLTHQQLADHVGASRANVSRALKRLERAGAIRCGRGRIELLAL